VADPQRCTLDVFLLLTRNDHVLLGAGVGDQQRVVAARIAGNPSTATGSH
jgi:hypothetical protein